MSSGCGDVLSLEDLKTAKKHQLFEAEVITGKAGGIATGGDIDYATNQVTGQTQKTLPAVLRDAGFRPAAFTFQTGGTLTVNDADVAVLWPVAAGGDGNYYVWKGSLPKTIPASSSPTSTGGVSESAWSPLGDITVRDYAQRTFKPLPYTRASGSFTTGGTATSGVSGLKHSDGMYYMPKSGTITATAGSSPDSNWICVGLLDKYELGDIRNFKGVGDGSTNDTAAVKAAIELANFTKVLVYVPAGFTFVCDKLQFTGVSNVTISGRGAIKMVSGRTGAFYYADGAQLTFINAYNLRIIGPEFDGNRAGSPTYTGFNHAIQVVTGTGDFRSNNGGATKPNQNIYIGDCYIHDQGGYNSGIDKFGDGVYLFGVDGAVIENNHFKDVGRWAVAASDCFNVRIVKNRHDCSKAGTVALGFVDIENESTDNTRGSYSRNITIADNNLIGFGQILVGAGNNSENNLGAQHYLRNVTITGNSLLIESNTHETASYLTNLVFIGVAPFCNVAPTTSAQAIDNSNIVIANNVLKCYVASNLAIGAGIAAQGTGLSSGIFNTVNGVVIKDNTIFGFNKGVQAAGTSSSTGYTFTNVLVGGNAIDCNGLPNSIGIRTAATQLVGVSIQGNTVRGATTRGVSVEDGVAIGAIDSYVMISDNEVYGTAGTNYFAYVYRASFQGNGSRGGALVLDATVNNMDKDYGNTWNHLLRTINGFTVNSMSQVTQDAIDIGSQTRFGYTVKLVPPFNLEGAQSSAMVTGPGLARAFITNMSGAVVTKSSDTWHLTVEKK